MLCPGIIKNQHGMCQSTVTLITDFSYSWLAIIKRLCNWISVCACVENCKNIRRDIHTKIGVDRYNKKILISYVILFNRELKKNKISIFVIHTFNILLLPLASGLKPREYIVSYRCFVKISVHSIKERQPDTQ